MEQEMKNDLIATYNEVKEGIYNCTYGNSRGAVRALEKALHWLGKYISPEDELQDLEKPK